MKSKFLYLNYSFFSIHKPNAKYIASDVRVVCFDENCES